MFGNEKLAGKFLFDQGIFSSTKGCLKCGNAISLNGQSFRCSRRTCRVRVSVRDGMVFSKMKASLNKVIFYLYYFIFGVRQSQITLHLKIISTAIASLNKYTKQLFTDAVNQCDVQISGLEIIVETDESKFTMKKYHRGYRVNGAWVLDGVERTKEHKIFAVVVKNRNAETLERIFQLHVLPSSIIHTDYWRGYVNLGQLGYIHRTVSHSETFCDPETSVHVNTIEGTWLGIKLEIPLRCRNRKVVNEYL